MTSSTGNPSLADKIKRYFTQAAADVPTQPTPTALEKDPLSVALDETIEVWACMMELRKHGTEGHIRRVTDMTLELARRMGITGEALAHIRRGALLHDIGEMNVPDSILLKDGPLIASE